jgi:hypothetical protein
VKSESDRAFKDWPKEVGPIITGSELDAYLKLQNYVQSFEQATQVISIDTNNARAHARREDSSSDF